MSGISRRESLQWLGGLAAGAALGPWGMRGAEVSPAPALSAAETEKIAEIVRAFMARFEVPGMSIAVARNGEMALGRGFGFSDPVARTLVTPLHRFRIASVSKPITAVTTFALIEQGKLGLDDRVFGAQGRLGDDYGRGLPGQVGEITVRHLLTHTCGGWGNKQRDPMFGNPGMGHRDLIRTTVRNVPLQHPPGTHHEYSNFGFCVLGRVLEKVSGRPYPELVQREVLSQCGAEGMRIGGNTRAERAPDEVAYVATGGGDPYRMNVARMDAHGGWVATAAELVRFASAVDGREPSRNILRPATIRTMTTPSGPNPGYACGWAVNRVANWWHTGSLPGTSSILVRTASGLCWAALANTRAEGIGPALDRMMWGVARAVPAWRAG